MTRKTNLPATIEFDEASLGPAMRALSPKRRAFVHFKVFYGSNNVEACRRAGYSPHPDAIGKTSWQVAHSADVQAAIEEEARKLMRTEGPKSVLTLVEIRDSAAASPRDRIKAATELLNRAGLHARTESTLNVNVGQLTDAEKDKEILRLAKELGLAETEARKMLIAPADFEKNSKGVYELERNAEGVYEVQPEVEAQRMQWRKDTNRYARRKKMSFDEREADRARVRREQSEQVRERGKREYAEHQARRAAEEVVTKYVDVNVSDDDDLSDVL